MGVPAKFYNYARALQSQTRYAKQMKLLSDSIFGEVKRPTSQESMKVVHHWSKRPYEIRKEIVEYYPAHEETTKLMTQLRDYGLYRDEHKDFKDFMSDMRKLRGKEKTWTSANRGSKAKKKK